MTDELSRVRPELRRPLVALLHRAPPFLFVVALVLAAFAGGMYVKKEKVFPHEYFKAAYKTGLSLFEMHFPKRFSPHRSASTDVPPRQDGSAPLRVHRRRCPRRPDPRSGRYRGFLRVLSRRHGLSRGRVRRTRGSGPRLAVPPDEIANAPVIADFPYEVVPGFRFSRHVLPFSISRYANGDLLVVFYYMHTFPDGGGVARIDRDGRVVWYRRDYSHHVPHLADDGDVALVPSLRIGEGPVRIRQPTGKAHRTWDLDCRRPRLDFVHVVDGEGRLLEEISVFDALVESRHGLLLQNPLPCDPTHLNFVHQVREDAGGGAGIEAGDLVVSLRNLNAFGILDRDDHRLKRLVRGTFFRQHSVTHLEGRSS